VSVGTAVCGSELRKKGAAVEAVGWSNRVCWRKTALLHGKGPSLLEEEETRGQRRVAGLCFWRRRRWRGKRCRFERRRRCWNRLEREKENEGLCREGSPACLW